MLELSIKCTNRKAVRNGKEINFKSYSVMMVLPVKQTDGTYSNPMRRWVDLKFTQGCEVATGLPQPKDLRTGTLIVNDNRKVDAPRVYQVKEVEGAKVYPCVWVHAYDGFREFSLPAEQSQFGCFYTPDKDVAEEVEDTQALPFEE